MTGPTLSIVIPIYNESANFAELMRRLKASLTGLEVAPEIILVDDGSTDGTLDLIREYAGHDKMVRFVSLSRNFGHQIAISAGLDRASGDGVVIMDGDLQDPPELLPELVAKWREGWDVVYAVKKSRKEGLLFRMCCFLFYRFIQLTADVPIPLDSGNFCLIDRKVANILRSMHERNRYIPGIRAWSGFRQTALPFDREKRYAGKPTFGPRRLVRLAADGLTSFSDFPLRLCGYLGYGMAFFSVLGLAYGLVGKLFFSAPFGWTSTIMAIFFIGGVQLIMLSIVGSYVGRIYTEVKHRPLYIVKETGNFDSVASS